VAEDFYRAFPLGLGETTIGMGDIDGVNFAGVKALEARTTHLAEQLTAAQAAIAARDARIAELETRLARIEAALNR
jgi:trimeric autotransporter adhesin